MENGQSVFFLRACEARASKTLTPHFADFFTDFEKKTDYFAVYCQQGEANRSYHGFVTVVISIIIIVLL